MSSIKPLTQHSIDHVWQIIKHCDSLGLGTGRTVESLLHALWSDESKRSQLTSMVLVSSSERTTQYIQQISDYQLIVQDPLQVHPLEVYCDGADVVNGQGVALKGLGGAMVGEKLLATQAVHFICMIQPNKKSDFQDQHVLPIAVIPQARSFVARALLKTFPNVIIRYRSGMVTDEGCHVLDVQNIPWHDLKSIESHINDIPGCLGHGLFAHRSVDTLVIDDGTQSVIESNQ